MEDDCQNVGELFNEHCFPDIPQDEEFWIEDGTLILVTRDVKFRVYRGVLTEHSSFFSTMLALPQPSESHPHSSDATPQPKPCPTVYLHDSSHDLRHIFRLLMPRRNARCALVASSSKHSERGVLT